MLEAIGYKNPTPVQAAVIPILKAGKDVVAQAETGTGKTAAFAMPILENVDPKSKTVKALILAPTRELALQVTEAFNKYGKNFNLTATAIYGGQSYTVQKQALKRNQTIVVATPGRLVDMLKQNQLKLDNVEHLILDEADEMLKMGFLDDVSWVIEQIPKNKQMALFSATMPKKVQDMAKKYLRKPEYVLIKPENNESAQITQQLLQVSRHEKLETLTRLLAKQGKCGTIIFVKTKLESMELAEKLCARGHSAAPINGDMNQAARENAIARLKKGSLDILVATDVAARGIDVERIEHVINYDMPFDVDSYVHRIGRTGRGGRTGLTTMFANPKEKFLLRNIEKRFGQLNVIESPTVTELNNQLLNKLQQDVLNIAQKSKKLGDFQAWAQELIAEETCSTEEKLAALAYYVLQDRIFEERPAKSESKNSKKPFKKREHQAKKSNSNFDKKFRGKEQKPAFKGGKAKPKFDKGAAPKKFKTKKTQKKAPAGA